MKLLKKSFFNFYLTNSVSFTADGWLRVYYYFFYLFIFFFLQHPQSVFWRQKIESIYTHHQIISLVKRGCCFSVKMEILFNMFQAFINKLILSWVHNDKILSFFFYFHFWRDPTLQGFNKCP